MKEVIVNIHVNSSMRFWLDKDQPLTRELIKKKLRTLERICNNSAAYNGGPVDLLLDVVEADKETPITVCDEDGDEEREVDWEDIP